MSFLSTSAGFLADLALIIQLTAFAILLFAVMNAKKKNFQKHFKTADIAVILGALAFLWMGLSFINNFPALISGFISPIVILTIMHIMIGSLALAGGILFVSNRLIKKTVIPMRTIFLLWAMALFLGITLYLMYYVF